MRISNDYPGTLQHQVLLQTIVSYYENDPRILAVAVFGSLGCGNWDDYSDLDLDIVVADGVHIEISQELEQLSTSFTSIGEAAVLIIPEHHDAGDIVLQSLMQLSLRYHPLATTSPNIVDSFQLLTGRLNRAIIEAAGLANRSLPDEPLSRLLDRCIRYAVGVDIALHRGQSWSAVELLHRMRGLLMELFTRTHQGKRAYQFFQAEADGELQARLGTTLPRYNLIPIQGALVQFLAILQDDLEQLVSGQVELTAGQREVLNSVYLRQAHLDLSDG